MNYCEFFPASHKMGWKGSILFLIILNSCSQWKHLRHQELNQAHYDFKQHPLRLNQRTVTRGKFSMCKNYFIHSSKKVKLDATRNNSYKGSKKSKQHIGSWGIAQNYAVNYSLTLPKNGLNSLQEELVHAVIRPCHMKKSQDSQQNITYHNECYKCFQGKLHAFHEIIYSLMS